VNGRVPGCLRSDLTRVPLLLPPYERWCFRDRADAAALCRSGHIGRPGDTPPFGTGAANLIVGERDRGTGTVKLPRAVVRIANAVTNLALIAGIPRPPYNRGNALVVETIGRRSGRRRRVPVGYLEDGGRIIVVVEDGSRAHWVRNSLANGGRLRIYFRGAWRPARLRVLDADPETYLKRMNRVHAAFVRNEASAPGVVELLPD
jgi:deazaflavin-dependent oxidoreductase (nitroreductase family)